MTGAEVLELPVGDTTVREYLKLLLLRLWLEQETFSPKRPLGNSDWAAELYRPLVAAGVIGGRLDIHDRLVDVSYAKADLMITRAIEAL